LLHLVGEDGQLADSTVHAVRLYDPRAALLIEECPEQDDGQEEDDHGHHALHAFNEARRELGRCVVEPVPFRVHCTHLFASTSGRRQLLASRERDATTYFPHDVSFRSWRLLVSLPTANEYQQRHKHENTRDTCNKCGDCKLQMKEYKRTKRKWEAVFGAEALDITAQHRRHQNCEQRA
jgi:hypothetical protein